MTNSVKKAVLILAFGGPASLDDVEPFLKNILKGRTIPPALLASAMERYRIIGGKSPLLEITNAQAAAIEGFMNKAGGSYKVYTGMRYWHPLIKDTMKKMYDDGVREILAVTMAPFNSPLATGGYEEDVYQEAKASYPNDLTIKWLHDWHIRPEFISIIADNVREGLAAFAKKEDALVIFSNHSVIMSALEGDPYQMKIDMTVAEVVKNCPCDYKTGFQSVGRGNPLDWLGPRVEDLIEGAKKAGKKGVLIVPLGFVSDHVETLYDIDILFKGVAEKSGLIFKRCPSLNTNPRFTELLAKILKSAIERFNY